MAQAKHIGKIVIAQHHAQGMFDGRDPFRSDAAYLISGGLGGLGLLLASWMVEKGARHLVLVGRSSPSMAAAETIRTLERKGASIKVVTADVSHEADLAQAMADIRATFPPLRGIVQCAGVLDDGVLLGQDWSRFSKVLAPKTLGSWNLHLATQDLPLDFFILFSSVASLLGPPGQGNYAAANAFLDALAHYRRSQGLPALSINWGAWADIGLAANLAVDLEKRTGVRAIAPGRGLQVLETAMERASTQLVAIPVNWGDFCSQFPDRASLPFLEEVRRESRPQVNGANPPLDPRSTLLRRLDEGPPGERRALLLTYLADEAARILGLDSSLLIDPRRPLNEVGLDSLMGIELRNVLGAATERALPATLLIDYPTLESLADYLAGKLLPGQSTPNLITEGSDDASNLEGMADAEIAALLEQKLAAIESGCLT